MFYWRVLRTRWLRTRLVNGLVHVGRKVKWVESISSSYRPLSADTCPGLTCVCTFNLLLILFHPSYFVSKRNERKWKRIPLETTKIPVSFTRLAGYWTGSFSLSSVQLFITVGEKKAAKDGKLTIKYSIHLDLFSSIFSLESKDIVVPPGCDRITQPCNHGPGNGILSTSAMGAPSFALAPWPNRLHSRYFHINKPFSISLLLDPFLAFIWRKKIQAGEWPLRLLLDHLLRTISLGQQVFTPPAAFSFRLIFPCLSGHVCVGRNTVTPRLWLVAKINR